MLLHRTLNLLVAAWLIGPLSLAGQEFEPFHANSRKLFANADRTATYSMAFDSTVTILDTVFYYNFTSVSDSLVPSNCGWWGGPECWPMDQPTWIGARVDAAADGVHLFRNVQGEVLAIPFHTDPLDTMVMYADSEQQFLLSYDGELPYSVMGASGSARHYTILHRDLANNPIASALNGESIAVGEDIGLIDFFRIDSFPMVLEPLDLIGDADASLGLHAISRTMLHDYQPGDEVQWHKFAYYPIGPPWQNYNFYLKWEILDRTDSPDSVEYQIAWSRFNADGSGFTSGTSTVAFENDDLLDSIPYERFDGTWSTLHMEARCDADFMTYRTYLNTGYGYCAEENCWGPVDTNGPPPTGGTTHILGLGSEFEESILSPTGYSLGSLIVYFKKNGTPCGPEVILGTPEHDPALQLTISPNPSDSRVNISANAIMERADILDPQGRWIARSSIQALSGQLDFSGYPDGIYDVQVQFSGGSRAARRVVIAR